MREIQPLCSFLNFLNKAIYPGRAFLRRMYAKYAPICKSIKGDDKKAKPMLKPHHHIRTDSKFKSDCRTWITFLSDSDLKRVVNRPMQDITDQINAKDISFFTDASAGKSLGFGCVYGNKWFNGKWEENFIKDYQPSIEFLELYALTAALITWQKQLSNCKIILLCDNQAIIQMVNNLSSKCKHCMYLIRLITLNGLLYNRCVCVVYIKSAENVFSYALSRLDMIRFR